MDIYKVLMIDRRTNTDITVYIKAEDPRIAFDCAVDRYGTHCTIDVVRKLDVKEAMPNE